MCDRIPPLTRNYFKKSTSLSKEIPSRYDLDHDEVPLFTGRPLISPPEQLECVHALSSINMALRAFCHGAMSRRIDPSWWTH